LPRHLADSWLRYVREALEHRRDVIDEYELNGLDFEGRIAVSGPDEVLAIVRDVSSRKRREKALAESEARLRLSLEAGRMGIWEWDLRTNKVWWSDNLEEVHGLPRGSFGGNLEAFLRLLHPDDRAGFDAAVADALQRGSDYATEFRIVIPDGEVRWMRGQGRVVMGEDGRPASMIGVGSDISALKRVEEELRALNSTLEARVQERTRELSERNSELESFVYTASHDLKSPLLSIQGMAELLGTAVERADPVEAAYCLERVNSNVAKMGRLLDDLLALSRIGRVGGEARDLDLAESFAQVLADLDAPARERGASVEGPRDWPAVHYPPTEAYQLLLNLLGNALKFASRVRLSWERDGGMVLLRVDDDGPGIAPEHREKVFGLFRKLDPNAPGTGVGLAIVRRIVERHGGKVWIEESPLGGARFNLTLPAA
ncbi:MAG TPA: ATP-binding protein, partial [Deinococcales bacterium]|nr:ATP-binding protein [Deinococcales bacterium]